VTTYYYFYYYFIFFRSREQQTLKPETMPEMVQLFIRCVRTKVLWPYSDSSKQSKGNRQTLQ